MAEPYLAQITIFAGNFNPRSWAQCDGQILPISQNQALFSLLGTTYGGDGQTTFALPDLRGRTPVHVGTGFNLGQKGGQENVPLTLDQIPAHRHRLQATTADATSISPAPASGDPPLLLADVENVTGVEQYAGTADVDMDSSQIGTAGTGIGHNNMQPFLALNYIIALVGVFPSRN